LEPPAETVSHVVTDIVTELVDLDVRRVALFGQCSGAILAFELAKALAEPDRGIDVTHLVVAAQRPPQDFAKAGIASEQDLMQYVPAQFREEPDLVELLLPIIASDIKLVSRYAYEPDLSIDVPLAVVYGACDEALSRAEVDGWRLVTTGPTSFHEIAGGDHLFGGQAWLELAETVHTALK
jgi:surfactin synthase thioesterase subunit